MTDHQGDTPWRHAPPERLPGETLEECIIRRAARMRKVQAFIAVYAEEIEALGDGPEADCLLKAIRTLQDEEDHLWLRGDEERFRPLILCFTIGEELEKLEALRPFPSLEVEEAQRDLEDRSNVCHYTIKGDLIRLRGEMDEARCQELWERACRDAAEARDELLVQGLIRPRAVGQQLPPSKDSS